MNQTQSYWKCDILRFDSNVEKKTATGKSIQRLNKLQTTIVRDSIFPSVCHCLTEKT